jgi:hypothetical protein
MQCQRSRIAMISSLTGTGLPAMALVAMCTSIA